MCNRRVNAYLGPLSPLTNVWLRLCHFLTLSLTDTSAFLFLFVSNIHMCVVGEQGVVVWN